MIYDYIIVGAGSSGCVLADRLSRDGRSQVLVLEAGSENHSHLISMPRGWAKLWRNPNYFWEFPIEPEAGRPTGESWAYGKGIGGSSSVNGTVFFRGQRQDYDLWEKMGNKGWNWEEISRCFRELEDYAPGDETRGKTGPLQITDIKTGAPIVDSIIAAGRQMGLPELKDVNGPRRLGVGHTQVNVGRHGRRVSAADAFLTPARHRPNLTVRANILAKRVLFEGNRAIGVLAQRDGIETKFMGREVIISAGVLQSPKLLQISGIGPANLLAKHQIPVIVDSPEVGRNMVEHVMMPMSFRLTGVPGINREFRGWRLYSNLLRYYLRRTGPMAYAASEVSAFFSLDGDQEWPNLQMCISPYSMEKTPTSDAGRGQTESTPGLTVVCLYLRPESRGSVEIRSGRIEDPPIVRANWLSDDRDGAAMVKAVKLVRRFMQQPALARYVGTETDPGSQILSDEQIHSTALNNLSSGLHGTATCRMGPLGEGVVDERLRVHGVEGLRVVDCSVMPTAISGNTNGPAMAVALRASELILEDRDNDTTATSAAHQAIKLRGSTEKHSGLTR